jgi:hypothetical protein
MIVASSILALWILMPSQLIDFSKSIFYAQCLSVVVIDDIECADLSPITQPV